MKLSFVIPCYRSEHTIEIVVDEIAQIMQEHQEKDYEIILVNDNSPDDVWNVICRLAQEREQIKGISLSRNFGQHAALMAGYAQCSGEYVFSLDDDGQMPLEAIYTMLAKCVEGYDVVYACYSIPHRSWFRRLGTWFNNKVGELMINQPKNFRGSSFYVAKRYVIKEMLKYQNSYPYLFGLVLRVTRNITSVETIRRDRIEGESGYSLKKLVALWVNSFTAFSVKPLEWGAISGVILAVAGIIFALVTIIRKLMGVDFLLGWSSIVSILLIVGGMILIMLGLIGEYIGRIYISINSAPQYVVKETTSDCERDDMVTNGEQKDK